MTEFQYLAYVHTDLFPVPASNTESGGKDLFMSTPNLKSSERAPSTGLSGIKKSVTGVLNPAAARSHKRSTSVSISSVTKKAGNVSHPQTGNYEVRPEAINCCQTADIVNWIL